MVLRVQAEDSVIVACPGTAGYLERISSCCISCFIFIFRFVSGHTAGYFVFKRALEFWLCFHFDGVIVRDHSYEVTVIWDTGCTFSAYLSGVKGKWMDRRMSDDVPT